MAESKRRQTKRKVDLVSSHSNNVNEDGPLAAYTLEGSAVSQLYDNDRDRNRNRTPAFMRYRPREGEQLIEEDVYIPDVD